MLGLLQFILLASTVSASPIVGAHSKIWRGNKTSVGHHKKTYSALCVVGKGENSYVREWVEYHRCLGIGQIHVFDHGSSSPMSKELKEDLQSGFATYRYFEGNNTKGHSKSFNHFQMTAQGHAYSECLTEFSGDHKFIGFIDFDEFLTLEKPHKESGGIDGLLRGYEAFGAVAFHWQIIGPSGHIKRPKGPVVSAFTECLPRGFHLHRQFKTFVNTKFKPIMISAHRPRFPSTGGETSRQERPFLVNAAKTRIESKMTNRPVFKGAVVYHYATKSREEFAIKTNRGGGAGITRTFRHFDTINRTALYGLRPTSGAGKLQRTPKPRICLGAVETRDTLCPPSKKQKQQQESGHA